MRAVRPASGTRSRIPRKRRAAASEAVRLACFHGRHDRRGHLRQPDDLVVDDAHPVLADGPHRELRLLRHSELPDQDHVEGRLERNGNFERDRHTAPREREHDEACPRYLREPSGELTPRVGSVSEQHHVDVTHRPGGAALR